MYTLQKNFAAVFLLCVMIFLMTGCGGNHYKHLTHDEAREFMNSNPHAIILDVRSPEEYEKKHIYKAILVPIDDLRAGDFSKLPDKKAVILVYCWTGRRASDAAEILAEQGYRNVYEFGGLIDWTGAVSGTDAD